jgi:ParB-like chromosome segregation protein Spo0J
MSKSDRVPSSTVELGIKFVQIAGLHSNDSNARTHSARQIRQIARSIERFGFTNPVLIDGNDKIICGHGRVAAARLLGLPTVPTIKIDHLSDEEVRA